MRFVFVLPISAGLILTSSIGFTREQQDLAEQQFKNIQSFKGKKASEVIPAMEFMSASLKQGCEFCHAADRASDEKPEKNTAREMIAMQNDINAKNFGGRNQVTCATCHAGHTHPIAFPPVEGVETRARRSKDVTPEQILSAYTKAAGSSSATAPTLSLKGSGMKNGEKSTVEEIHRGNQFYVSIQGAKTSAKQGFDGTNAWFSRGTTSMTIPPQYATQFLNQETLLLGPDTLPKLENMSAGTSKIDSHDMLVLNGTLAGSTNRASIYFDKLTGLPARLVYTYPTILGSIAQINDFSDYRKEAGILVPMTVAHHSSEDDVVAHFTSVHVNPKIDPTIFAPEKKS